MNANPGMITSAEGIIAAARALADSGRRKRVAVAGAQDSDVIGALASAQADGLLEATLYGDEKKIRKIAKEEKFRIGELEIVNQVDPYAATHEAVKAASEGKADVIMKGFVSTSALLKTVLSKEFNLRLDRIISHVAVLGIPGYHKLLAMTDGGMVVAPDRNQKKQILANAILVCRALGINPIRAALSSAVDYPDKNIPSSVEAFELAKELSGNNELLVQGPLTFEAALSKDIAGLKNVEGPVAGEADIFLVNTIEECNIAAKGMINFGETIFAGVIVGARVPVSLVSRTDTMKNKKTSVALACLLADYYQTQGEGGRS